jgi:hypothetical protein
VVALCGGVIARVMFQILLPRDGSYVLPFGKYSFDYGKGQSGLVSGYQNLKFSKLSFGLDVEKRSLLKQLQGSVAGIETGWSPTSTSYHSAL